MAESSMPVEARVDIKALAGVISYLRSKGINVRSLGSAAAIGVETYYQAICFQKLVQPVQTISEAKAILDSVGLGRTRKSVAKSLMTALTKESVELESDASLTEEVHRKLVAKKVTEEEIQKAMEELDK